MENFYRNQINFNYRDVQHLNNRTLYVSINENANVNEPVIVDTTDMTNPILLLIINLLNLLFKILQQQN